MTVANRISILVPLFGLAGAAILYGLQKSIDRKNQILSERRILYREFISIAQDARVKLWMTKDGAVESWFTDYKTIIGELMVTAPDPVIEAAMKFDDTIRYLPRHKRDDSKVEFKKEFSELTGRYAELVFQMRKDSFGKTKVTRESAEQSIQKTEEIIGKVN